jgi:transglutaminase-like putative cysteine protease
MTRRSTLLPAAAGSVLATMMALSQAFAHQKWLGPSILAVGVAFGVGWVGRRLDVPGALAPALSLLALVAFTGIVFHAGTTAFGLPTSETMRAIGDSLSQAVRDIRALAAPAEPTDALTLLATTGVFVVAMLVDLVVFRIRRPVAAGLPLLLLFLVPTAMADHAAAWAFVVAAAGYLGLLVAEGRDRARGWGRRLSGIDTLDDVADVSHVARVGRRIGTAAVGVALCVPLALPDVGKGLFTGTGGGPFGRNGGSSQASVINPIVTIKGQLQDDEVRELLTVRTDAPENAYLRLTTLNSFDGAQWNLVQQTAQPDHKVGGKRPIPLPAEVAAVPTTQTRYDVEVGPLSVRWLPLPYVPTVVDIGGDWRWEPTGLAVFSTHGTSHNADFSVVATAPSPTRDQLRKTGELPPGIGDYLAVPEIVPPAAARVLDEVTAGKDNPYDRALALNEFFFATGGFRYDLNYRSKGDVDPVTDFLAQRRGYCEQYAGVMAYLARLAGIPARVVVGFTPGRFDDGRWHVTNKDAHAWPELYFPNAGWVRFEPTPRPGTIRPDYARPAVTPTTPATPTESGAPSATPEPTATRTAGPKGRDEANSGDTSNNPGARGPLGGHSGVSIALLVALLASLLLATPSLVAFLTRRRRRSSAGDHLARTHAAWASFADAAEDAGYALRRSDSPRASARRLVLDAALTGEPADEVLRLARAEERARYARTFDPVDGLDASVRVVRRALRASLPRVGRVRSVVFPVSALRRIAEAARSFGDRVERQRTASARWVWALGRRLRPRRARAA